MALRDEKIFSDEEFIAAFSFILPPDRAREEGIGFNSMPDYQGWDSVTPEELADAPVAGPRSYDGDILDLLSLVSESCAERAWRLLGISPAEGARRRDAFRLRVEEAQRWRDLHPGS
jgi:hypothetical protein